MSREVKFSFCLGNLSFQCINEEPGVPGAAGPRLTCSLHNETFKRQKHKGILEPYFGDGT